MDINISKKHSVKNPQFMTRSVWKGPFVDACLFKQKKIKWKIWSRRSCILPQFVGCYAQIYNGKGSVG